MAATAAAPPAQTKERRMGLAAQVEAAIKGAGVPIVGVSIGDSASKATWVVSPPHLQSAAQPTIDAFNASDPAHEQAELDRAIVAELDRGRLASAIVWAVIDTYSAPATVAKFVAARTKIINAYKARPWL